MKLQYTLDASRFNGMETFYDEVIRTFSFPDHFGRNLDALYDCLTDIGEDMNVIWINSEKSRTDFADDATQPGFFGQVVATFREVHGLELELR